MSKIAMAGVDAPLTVLFAPAHTLIDEDQFGSDYYWAYKLIERLTLGYGIRIIALTVQPRIKHVLPGVEFISVHPGGAIPVSPTDSLRFHLRTYVKARQILRSKEHIDIIHHMLPFGFRATFNILALLHWRAYGPIVIGPLQPPYLQGKGKSWHVQTADDSFISGAVSANHLSSLWQTRQQLLFNLITTPILSILSGETLRRAAAVVAVSEYGARRYRSYAQIATDRFYIIPPGVDTHEFTPLIAEEHTDMGIDTVDKPVTILACGRLTHRKAFDVLLKVMGKLVEGGLPVHLRIVGDGPERKSLEALGHSLGIDHAVTFVGPVLHSAIVHEYRRADIFCSPSLGEGFATVSLEALACGLPIVATPAGGFREILSQHQVGILVPFGAVNELASALATLVNDRARRVMLGHQARMVATQEYDWHVIAGRYVKLYSSLLAATG